MFVIKVVIHERFTQYQDGFQLSFYIAQNKLIVSVYAFLWNDTLTSHVIDFENTCSIAGFKRQLRRVIHIVHTYL